MEVVIASSSEIAEPVLTALQGSTHQVLAGISMPDKPAGRGRLLQAKRFSVLCERVGIPLYKPEGRLELNEALTSLAPDLVITIAYGRLIKSGELNIPKYGWLNIHFSLLPRWRGAAPVQRAIQNGDSETGISIFQLDEGMDTGPIFLSKAIPLRGTETFGSLLSELSSLAAPATLQVLEMIEAGSAPTPQSHETYTSAPKLSKDEARIQWHKSATEIDRQIRAMNPWPIAWSTLDGQRLSILSAVKNDQEGEPGSVLSTSPLIIGCGENSLEILSIKPEGKKQMTANEWVRGARISQGTTFR